MQKLLICALPALALLSGCTNSPAHRIAECQKQGGTEASCTAAEWDHEKAHPLPTYNSNSYDNASVLQAAYNANAAKGKTSAD